MRLHTLAYMASHFDIISNPLLVKIGTHLHTFDVLIPTYMFYIPSDLGDR